MLFLLKQNRKMIRTLSLLLLSTAIVTAGPLKMKIKVVHQKVVEATGQPYGSPGGIYFEFSGMDPFLPYWVQYSHDLTKWEDLYNFGSFGTNATSPLFHWFQLPPQKCFFRIIQKY